VERRLTAPGTPRAPTTGSRDPVRITWTAHLVELVGQAGAAAGRIRGATLQARRELAPRAAREWARFSARLDGSPLSDETAEGVDAGTVAPPAASSPGAGRQVAPADPSGGWARALHLDGMETQDVAAVEYANLLACAALEPHVTELFFERPLEALARLHGAISRGLVEPDVIGRPRRTEQAVHDGAQGHVLYYAADPEALPGLLDGLGRWLSHDSAALPSLVVAGVVQERVLEWQPFEAGNGRLARAASRVVLRGRGLDPDGLAVAERLLAADATGYYREVGATRRRRGELSGWLERYGEALVASLTDTADALDGGRSATAPPRAVTVLSRLVPGSTVTLREYAEAAEVTLATARIDLEMCVSAEVLEPQPRSSGLRFRLPAPLLAAGVRTDGARLPGADESVGED